MILRARSDAEAEKKEKNKSVRPDQPKVRIQVACSSAVDLNTQPSTHTSSPDKDIMIALASGAVPRQHNTQSPCR